MLPSEDLRSGGAFARARRPADAQVRAETRAILSRMRTGGNAALLALSRGFDEADSRDPHVAAEQLDASADAVPREVAGAIARANPSTAGLDGAVVDYAASGRPHFRVSLGLRVFHEWSEEGVDGLAPEKSGADGLAISGRFVDVARGAPR